MSNKLDPSSSPGLAEPVSFRAAQLQVDQWIQLVGVRYFSELGNLAQLMEEVGELARMVSRTYGEQSYKPDEVPSDLADELADVLFVLVCLANQTGVDLEHAWRANLTKKTHRDGRRHHDNPKLSSSPTTVDKRFFDPRLGG